MLRLYIIIGVLLGFLALIIHELLHAIVYPKNANVYIGIAKPITFVALASYPLKKEKIYSYVSVTLHFRNNTIDFILDNAYNRYENT